MSLALQVQFCCYLFFYIAVKRLVALFTVAQFFVAQYLLLPFFRCIFPLPFFFGEKTATE